MSNKICALTVALEDGVDDEHSDRIIMAIKLISGVADVCKNVEDITHYIAKSQVKLEVKKNLLDWYESI